MNQAQNIIQFYENLSLDDIRLPQGIRVMNPYQEAGFGEVIQVLHTFFQTFYADQNPRRMILGINPGRHGAGITGIMFTDTKHLTENCGIKYQGNSSHEPSSDFFYRVVEQMGGAKSFYGRFYVGAICPLGFTMISESGKEINTNYYDHPQLLQYMLPFVVSSLRAQLDACTIIRDVCFCLGTGKNYSFLKQLNQKHHFFGTIEPLEHPRYILQYKFRQKEAYADKYCNIFNKWQNTTETPKHNDFQQGEIL